MREWRGGDGKRAGGAQGLEGLLELLHRHVVAVHLPHLLEHSRLHHHLLEEFLENARRHERLNVGVGELGVASGVIHATFLHVRQHSVRLPSATTALEACNSHMARPLV